MNMKKISFEDRIALGDGGDSLSNTNGATASALGTHEPAVNAISVSEKQAKSLVDSLAIPVGHRSIEEIQSIKRCLKNVRFFQDYQDSENYLHVLQNLELERRSSDSIPFREIDIADKFFIILSGRIGLYIEATPSTSTPPASPNPTQPAPNQQELKTIRDAPLKLAANLPNSNQSTSSTSSIDAPPPLPVPAASSMILRSFGVGVKEIAQLDAGDAFGEIGLLYNQERTATAICLIPTSLLVLKKHIFEKYLSQSKNTKVSAMIEFYQSIWLLHSLSEREIRTLSTKTVLNQCAKHTIIIRQGETPKGIYFVQKGIVKIIVSLRLRIDANGEFVLDTHGQPQLAEGRYNELYKTIDVQIDEIGNGSIFADYEVYNNKKIEYTAVAGTFSEILTINLADFKQSLPDDVYANFAQQVKHYPTHQAIKKQYLENLAWHAYKNDVIHSFNTDLVNRIRTQKLTEHRMPFLPKVSLDKYEFYDDEAEADPIVRKSAKQTYNNTKAATNQFKKKPFDDDNDNNYSNLFEFSEQYSSTDAAIEQDLQHITGIITSRKPSHHSSSNKLINNQIPLHASDRKNNTNQILKPAMDSRQKSSRSHLTKDVSAINSRSKPINSVYQSMSALKQASIRLQQTTSMQKIPGEFKTELQQELNELLSKAGTTAAGNTHALAEEYAGIPSSRRNRPTSLLASNRVSQHNIAGPTTAPSISKIIPATQIALIQQQQLQSHALGQQKSTKLIQANDGVVSTVKLPVLQRTNMQRQSLTTSKQILPIIKKSSKITNLAMEIY